MVAAVTTDLFGRFAAAKMTHILSAAENFSGTGNLKSFGNDFSGFLFEMWAFGGHSDPYFFFGCN
jgi:hypothetical protein